MRRREASSIRDGWAGLCAEAALGGLGTLAVVPAGELLRDPTLRRLMRAVAQEAASAARKAGLRVAAAPAEIALERCRRHPERRHPWQRALRQSRATGARAVFAPLLAAARRTGAPVPRLALIADVLRRLDRKR